VIKARGREKEEAEMSKSAGNPSCFINHGQAVWLILALAVMSYPSPLAERPGPKGVVGCGILFITDWGKKLWRGD